MLPEAPIAERGFFVTHFLTVKDQAKSAEFYCGNSRWKGGDGGKDPTCLKLANSWLILN